MLHFRSFIIPALMAGAALFLPNQAFAEKHEPSGQENAHVAEAQPSLKQATKAVSQGNVPLKPQQVNTVMEKKAAVPAPASNAKGLAVQRGLKQAVSPKQTVRSKTLPSQAVQRGAKQAVSQKQIPGPKTLPSQANGNGYGHSAIKNEEKPTVVNTVQEEKNQSVTDQPLKQADSAVEKRTAAPKEPVPVSVEMKSKKVKRMEPAAPVPVKKKVPASKEELPTVDQSLNPAPRSNSGSGGQSNDRVSQGLHTISFLEKWFEWNKHYEIKLVQPFLSRYNLKHHQWVNAPPSPPPQTAPFLKTVTRS
ncbi:hypothetical protein L1999_26570 [Neobacillus drentensis]|uniref:hypothetical protein n=1 Tax=Neobacillus drentensis TaxID=220684 RepID=UPI001F293030|nr:hypothetical protein [Neobacillus drentensis]ULT56559.1 hypothetical protein L1999_26570 [Neobacillus drentensis]